MKPFERVTPTLAALTLAAPSMAAASVTTENFIGSDFVGQPARTGFYDYTNGVAETWTTQADFAAGTQANVRDDLVTDSLVLSGVLTAVGWLTKKPYVERIFLSPTSAVGWLAEQCTGLSAETLWEEICGEVGLGLFAQTRSETDTSAPPPA